MLIAVDNDAVSKTLVIVDTDDSTAETVLAEDLLEYIRNGLIVANVSIDGAIDELDFYIRRYIEFPRINTAFFYNGESLYFYAQGKVVRADQVGYVSLAGITEDGNLMIQVNMPNTDGGTVMGILTHKNDKFFYHNKNVTFNRYFSSIMRCSLVDFRRHLI